MKKIFCLLVLFNALFSLRAQNSIPDSLSKLIATAKEDTDRVKLMNSLSAFYLRKRYDPDSALLYEQQGLDLSRKINYRAGEVNALSYIGWIQYKLGQQVPAIKTTWLGIAIHDKFLPNDAESLLYLWDNLTAVYADSRPDSCIYYSEKMLKLAQATGNLVQQAAALENMGFEWLFLGNYPRSLEISLKEQALFERNNDSLDMAFCDREMGNVYMFLNNYNKALSYYNTAQTIAKTIGSDSAQYLFCPIYLSKARLFFKINDLDSSLHYAQLSYDLSEKTYNRLIMARLLYLFGNIYEKKGNDTLALQYFRKGIRLSEDHDLRSAIIEASNSLARYFYNKKTIDSCIFYAMRSVDVIHESGFIIDAPETYDILASAYAARKNIDSTIKYKDLFQASKDTLLGVNRTQQVQQILFDQEQQRKQEQASVLAYKNNVKFYTLVAGIIALILVAVLLFRNNRSKQKAYDLLQKQKAETDLQKEKADKALNDLRSTQTQLIQSEKMASLGELTAGIAHEIQNPLNFVNNFSEVNTELSNELAQEAEKGNIDEVKIIAKDIKENSEKINHHGKRADAIVKGMLQHSRSSTGVKEPTDINALADEYLRLGYHGLRAKDKEFNATMKTDFDESIGKINIIPQDIGRVLLNLYNNAFYAVNEKKKNTDENYQPTVSVQTKKINDKIEIRVIDNGSGIPQKVVDKIFQPFFTTKPTGQGTGLGLSLSYDIIKAHGGEIKVEIKENEGTTFIILLPAK